MTDNPTPASRPGVPPRNPGERRPVAAPGPALSDGRRSLHDQQRDLMRASLLARSPAEDPAHRPWE